MQGTLNSAIVIPLLNLRFTSKELRVLVKRTDTVGLLITVTLSSIFPVANLIPDQWGWILLTFLVI